MRHLNAFLAWASRTRRAAGILRTLTDDASQDRANRKYQRLYLDPLEDRRMMTAEAGVETTFADQVDVDVVGRLIFYNNSAFDGANIAANAADDAAIATDKSALLPGGTATFANYTSYSRGINGLMIDMAGLPSSTLSATDFSFRVGNVNDPTGWTAAPAPTSITVRLGAGTQGSARVEIIWPDGAITKQWLEVTVNATVKTGLKTPDVFYFGNAVGESGNDVANALVDAADVTQVEANQHPTADGDVTLAWDFNRDRKVDAADTALASNNATSGAGALQLIAPPVVTFDPPDQRLQIELFNDGDGGFPQVFAPAIVTTNAGTVLAFAEGRSTQRDDSGYAIVLRRSTDGGVTWSPPKAAFQIAGVIATDWIGNVVPIIDKQTGNIVVVFNRKNSEVWVIRSTDDGLTWSAGVDVTASVKVTAGNNPGPPGMYPDTPWGWYAVGPGHGIQIQNGDHAGRLIVGADHRESTDINGKSWSHIIYSDDGGVTWHLGGGLVGNSGTTNHPNDYSNENTIAEIGDNGQLLMSVRINNNFVYTRGVSRSSDGGMTWSTMYLDPNLISNKVQGSLLRLNDDVLLFTSPMDRYDDDRRQTTIWVSLDDGFTWSKSRTVFFGYSGYSDMTVVGPDTILLTYNRGHSGGSFFGGGTSTGDNAAKIGLLRINLRALLSTDPYEFSWYFNELPVGESANKNGPSIQDYGPMDQRAWPYSGAAAAPVYVDGAAGDTALRLTSTTDEVVLVQGYNTALQAAYNPNFTVQVIMKTTDTDGVIISSRPTVENWTLQVVGGKLQFSLWDLTNIPSITSTAAINDGQWHHIAAVRDAGAKQLRIYIDGVEAAPAVIDTTNFKARNGNDPLDPFTLGSYNTQIASSQLEFDVDTVRFTQGVLAPSAFIPLNFDYPKPPLPKTYPATAPTSIPGLQFWLPPYDSSLQFADFGAYSDPQPLAPYPGMAIRSAIDASDSGFKVQTDTAFHQVTYARDLQVGPYWVHKASSASVLGSPLVVHSIGGSVVKNFDFVQNTGNFTISTFAKVDSETGNAMTLFDTNNGKTTLSGFSLVRKTNGRLTLKITGNSSLIRYQASTNPNTMLAGQWYHIAVVGNGAGNLVQIYVTAASRLNVDIVQNNANLVGLDGTYNSFPGYDLSIGSLANTLNASTTEPTARPANFLPFNGGMVNEAIFNRALTSAEIQKLFEYGKSLAPAVPPRRNPTQPLDVDNNGKIEPRDVQRIINRLLTTQAGLLPVLEDATPPPPYVDTSGNNLLEPRDAKLVIDWLLVHPAGVVPQAIATDTSSSADDVTEPLSVDSNLAADGPMASPLAAAVQDERTAAPAADSSANEPIAVMLSLGTSSTSSASVSTTPLAVAPAVDTTVNAAPATGAATIVMIQPTRTAARVTSDEDHESAAAADEVFAGLGL